MASGGNSNNNEQSLMEEGGVRAANDKAALQQQQDRFRNDSLLFAQQQQPPQYQPPSLGPTGVTFPIVNQSQQSQQQQQQSQANGAANLPIFMAAAGSHPQQTMALQFQNQSHQQQPQAVVESQPFLTSFIANQPALTQGFAFNASTQQMMPVILPFATNNRNPFASVLPQQTEPSEAAVSRPLSIISLFCWFQIWFSIPAIVFAFKRNKPKSNYNTSIALSVTAIVIGLCATFIMMVFGLIMPFRSYGYYHG